MKNTFQIFKKNFQKNFQNTRHVLVYTTKIYYIHLPIYSIHYINTIISTSKKFVLFYKKYSLILKYDFYKSYLNACFCYLTFWSIHPNSFQEKIM